MAVVHDQGIVVRGLPELQRAFERVSSKADFGLEYELQRRLRNIGEHVAASASAHVTHRTGRHGDPSLPRLEDTVRVSVTARRSTVYSNSPYAAVQNFGGGPKRGWLNRGPHIKRENASRWMSQGVADERAYVDAEFESVLDWIEHEWNA